MSLQLQPMSMSTECNIHEQSHASDSRGFQLKDFVYVTFYIKNHVY